MFFGVFAFGSIEGLHEIEFLSEPNFTFFWAPFSGSGLSTVTLPDGAPCRNLPNVNVAFFFFGTPLSTVTDWSFTQCIVDDSTPPPSISGWTFASYDPKRLDKCSLSDSTLTVPSQVYYISGGALSNLQCTTLQFAEGSHLTHIDEGAFIGTPLRSVTFPPSFEKLNSLLFGFIETLTSVTYNGLIKVIQANCLLNCTSLTSLKMNAASNPISILDSNRLDLTPFNKIGPNAFLGVPIQSVILSSSVIGHAGLQFNNVLETVTITDDITGFPAYCFSGCFRLGSIIANPPDSSPCTLR